VFIEVGGRKRKIATPGDFFEWNRQKKREM
jgi:hypothetical protein